jgi:hypothetical protein
MIRHTLVLWSVALSLMFVTACFETHSAHDTAVRNTDCYTCHKPEYDATGPKAAFPTSPIHSTQGCNTDCAQCHTTTVWANALGGCVHPEAGFPLSTQGTQHTNIKCTDCHSLDIQAATGATAALGANTDCISCHPNTSTQQNNHIGVTYDTGTNLGAPYAYSTSDHRFCLDCHPTGLAIGHGASNPFRLPHHNAACGQCHDNASGLGHAGGADVLCVNSGCHQGAHHNDTNHHPGCITCHQSGGGG